MLINNTYTTAHGTAMQINIVFEGDKYGRDDCLTYSRKATGEKLRTDINHDVIPLIEFYSVTEKGSYFISRYYWDTLCVDHDGAGGLCLDGSQRKYDIDSKTYSLMIKDISQATGTTIEEKFNNKNIQAIYDSGGSFELYAKHLACCINPETANAKQLEDIKNILIELTQQVNNALNN